MASDVQIANRALSKIGDKRITSLSQDSEPARAINECYVIVRQSEIRRHPWHFAKKRVSLAADVDTPAFDFEYQFTLPSDCLRLLMPGLASASVQADGRIDWKVEGRKILTNDEGPLYINYLGDVTDPNLFDAAFVDVFASRLAMEVAHRLTNSTEKRKMAQEEYRAALAEARRMNAFEQFSVDRPTDDWELARL